MSVQLENGYIRIANEIWDEIIRRDFSKRQKDILLFIWRLSYGCNRKTAIIPLLKDFEMCGVTPTNVTKEIKHLVECKVIEWDRQNGLFWFNKDYRFWQISPVKGWDTERYKELIHININEKTYQNDKSPQQELIKTISVDLSKQEVGQASNPWESKAEGVSKDSIKDIQEEEEKKPEISVIEAYRKSFGQFNMTGHITGYIVELKRRGFTDTFVREVILEMGTRGINPDERYMRKLAEDWISRGIYTQVEAARKVIPLKIASGQNSSPRLPDLEPMTDEDWNR